MTQKYIALLRGVNVGGKNLIAMPRLKAAVEECGFSDVKTYINSGNVIFSSDVDDLVRLKETMEGIIEAAFHLNIPVAVLSAEDLRAALLGAPDWWGTSGDTKHNAIFVLHPATPEDIMREVGAINPEYEQIGHCGQVIFWSAPLKTFSKVRWIKIVSTSAYQSVTIRNANTTKKLLELVT